MARAVSACVSVNAKRYVEQMIHQGHEEDFCCLCSHHFKSGTVSQKPAVFFTYFCDAYFNWLCSTLWVSRSTICFLEHKEHLILLLAPSSLSALWWLSLLSYFFSNFSSPDLMCLLYLASFLIPNFFLHVSFSCPLLLSLISASSFLSLSPLHPRPASIFILYLITYCHLFSYLLLTFFRSSDSSPLCNVVFIVVATSIVMNIQGLGNVLYFIFSHLSLTRLKVWPYRLNPDCKNP